MDWQEVIALTIVAATAALFVRSRLRARRSSSACQGGCGCATPSRRPPPPSVIYRARKGQRPEILIRQK